MEVLHICKKERKGKIEGEKKKQAQRTGESRRGNVLAFAWL